MLLAGASERRLDPPCDEPSAIEASVFSKRVAVTAALCESEIAGRALCSRIGAHFFISSSFLIMVLLYLRFLTYYYL
jgi:hypothetical protein